MNFYSQESLQKFCDKDESKVSDTCYGTSSLIAYCFQHVIIPYSWYEKQESLKLTFRYKKAIIIIVMWSSNCFYKGKEWVWAKLNEGYIIMKNYFSIQLTEISYIDDGEAS